MLGITFGLLLTPVGLLYTDISQGLNVATSLWFLATPVIYPPSNTFPFSLLTVINPVSPVLVGIRDMATRDILYNPLAFFVVTFATIICFILTWIVYRLTMPVLAERMSA